MAYRSDTRILSQLDGKVKLNRRCEIVKGGLIIFAEREWLQPGSAGDIDPYIKILDNRGAPCVDGQGENPQGASVI